VPKEDVYLSIDIEPDCPDFNSMLSLGAIAFMPDGSEGGRFSAKPQELEGLKPDPDTLVGCALC